MDSAPLPRYLRQLTSSNLKRGRVVANDLQTDPDDDYIRHFVPELKGLRGKGTSPPVSVSTTAITEIVKAIHESHKHPSEKEMAKLGYPKPIVDHFEAKDRALRRYKNPGET